MDAQALATDIVRKLVKTGYVAYFAGGWVRDYLMGHPSDDIDIATNAPPEKILDLFPRTILVGLAFGVVIVISDGHQFEVATFRRDINYFDGRKPMQIELSTPEEDAIRRDFTINGMFYDPLEHIIHDYVHGAEDLKRKVIRTIGDPYERFFEDRLRMIRAVRFAARFGFSIDSETQEAIHANAITLLPAVAMERVWQELCKMSKYPHFDHAIIEMHRLELLQTIFPTLKEVHLNEIKKYVSSFAFYPQGATTIMYLMALFPNFLADDGVELCRYLHTSMADAKLAEFIIKLRGCTAKEAGQKGFDKVEWTHLYAHPATWVCLQVVAASMKHEDRDAFMQKHSQRRQSLCQHIRRFIEKKPLINAGILQQRGILPGKMMGTLLKTAEKLVIEHDLEDVETVLARLKALPIWRQ